MAGTYQGSLKHKDRPARGRKGTICPEWTHVGSTGTLGTDPHAFSWTGTTADELFVAATVDQADQRRYATRRGVAFEAKPTEDGTWHGYPLPWEDVPAWLKDRWLDDGSVTKREVRRYFSRPKKDIRRALESDDG